MPSETPRGHIPQPSDICTECGNGLVHIDSSLDAERARQAEPVGLRAKGDGYEIQTWVEHQPSGVVVLAGHPQLGGRYCQTDGGDWPCAAVKSASLLAQPVEHDYIEDPNGMDANDQENTRYCRTHDYYEGPADPPCPGSAQPVEPCICPGNGQFAIGCPVHDPVHAQPVEPDYGDSTATQHRSDTRGPCLACRHRDAAQPTNWRSLDVERLAYALHHAFHASVWPCAVMATHGQDARYLATEYRDIRLGEDDHAG